MKLILETSFNSKHYIGSRFTKGGRALTEPELLETLSREADAEINGDDRGVLVYMSKQEYDSIIRTLTREPRGDSHKYQH